MEIDIWRTARLLISEYGEDAAVHAAIAADKFLDKGDLDGCAVWKRITSAIDELLSNNQPAGVVVH